MTELETVTLRREELARRVEALPSEIDTWITRSRDDLDMNAHFSQLNALDVFMDVLVERQRTLLTQLDPAADGEAFRSTALQLVQEIIKTQRVWDYFRDKLELRFSPDFSDALWVADTIAWDCYRPVMDRAVAQGIVPAANVREPPLTYLTAEFSPATWVRGSRPNDGRDYSLGTATLPVPVIELPWDHMGNLWELVSLQHEVGHDLEADLHLREELRTSLGEALGAAGAPQDRVKTWTDWEGEIFADLIGLQLGGPAFTLGLMHLLLLPSAMVTTYNKEDPHPTHWVRVLMNAAYVRTLVPDDPTLEADASAIEAAWKDLYGDVPALAPFLADFTVVFKALMDTGMQALDGKTVRELMPYTAADDAKIRQAAAFLETGQNAPSKTSIPPRHTISAARLAVAAIVEAGVTNGGGAAANIAAKLGEVNQRLVQLVKDQAKPGLRAGDDSTPHKDFIKSLAENL